MIVQITFRLFLVCLFVCVFLILHTIWVGEHIDPLYFQINATTFVIGLASFLIWFSLTLKSIVALLRDKADTGHH